MAKQARDYVCLRKNITISTFLSLCNELFDAFPSYKEWERIIEYAPDCLFPIEKLCEVIFMRFLKRFNNLTIGLLPKWLTKSYHLIFNHGLTDCYNYYNDSETIDEAYFKKNAGILELGEDILYYMENHSCGLGLIEHLPRLRYFSLHSCSTWCEDAESVAFINQLPGDENTGKEIVRFHMPELMDSDPDIYHESEIVQYIVDAAMYASDFQTFEIYECNCLKDYHKWLEHTDIVSLNISAVTDMITKCEDILANSCLDYMVSEWVETRTSYYFARLTGYNDTEHIMADAKCLYPMAFFAITIIDILLQYLNSRYRFYAEE